MRRLISVQRGMKRSSAQLVRERPLAWPDGEKGGAGLSSEEIRAHDEAVDDVEAASLGRSRMADGRRIELSVEELARLVDAGADGSL